MTEKAKCVCFIYMQPQKVKFKIFQINMKRVSYWCSSILSVSQFSVLRNHHSTRDYVKLKNNVHLIEAPFKTPLNVETYPTIKNDFRRYGFQHTNGVCPFTVNSEIFTRIFFTRIELNDIFATFKIPKLRHYLPLLYDWRESCLLIGPICVNKSLCLPGNWSKPVHKLILHENQLGLGSRS